VCQFDRANFQQADFQQSENNLNTRTPRNLNTPELLLSLDNVEKTSIYFHWNLIEKDPDDNKFVDCAVSARVKYIVTNDKHFKHLKNIDFPPIEVVSADDFLHELEEMEEMKK